MSPLSSATNHSITFVKRPLLSVLRTPQKDLIGCPWLIVDRETACMILRTRLILTKQKAEVHLYSDGSLINRGSCNKSMAFASVYSDEHGGHQCAVLSRMQGPASSSKAELA